MTKDNAPKDGPRGIGQYVESGEWGDYWRTSISHAGKGAITVRGYPIGEIIEKLSFVEMIYLLIRGVLPTEQQADGLDLVLRSGADQQFINSSVPPARFVASAAPESPVAALASGILAFGSVTGSPQDCATMILAAEDLMTSASLSAAEAAAAIVDHYRGERKRIPGLGHPMHKEQEPRVTALRKRAGEIGLWGGKAAILEAIQGEFANKVRPIPINLAGAIACVMAEMEFDPLEMSGLAVMLYMPALIAHTVEEIKDGVPLRIIPDALGAKYIGEKARPLPSRFKDRGKQRRD